MKKLYSFVMLMVLATSFSLSAVAQHYVKIVNTTITTGENKLEAGSIIAEEVDSAKVCYVHIIRQSSTKSLHKNGVVDGAKFLITEFNADPLQLAFLDEGGETRRDCFKEGEILVKVGDDYVKYSDIKFLNALDVNNRKDEILQEIKGAYTYDPKAKCVDLTACTYSYVIKGNKYTTGNKEYNIEPDTQITFITSDQEVPDIVLLAKDFKTVQKSESWGAGITQWLKENWIIALCSFIGLCVIACIVYWILKRKKSNPKGVKETAAPKASQVVDEGLHQKLNDVLAGIEATQTSVRNQATTLESIRLLVTNTEEKKLLAQKSQELDDEKKKSAAAMAQSNAALAEVASLKEEVARLQAASQIEGTVQLTEYSSFVSFAKMILCECVDAEKLCINYWGTLDSKDQQRLNGFLSKYQIAKCQIDLAKWNGIIATLDLKGYVKNDDYITYMTPLSDKDRLAFLMKRFFEDIVRPYVGATVLFLEQIRTANNIGVSVACNGNIDGFINSICTKCHEQGVLIDYRKLYEKVTEYDTLEIDENIPAAIKEVVANIEAEDILLYVDKYAVNLKSGEMAEKTRCYIKI